MDYHHQDHTKSIFLAAMTNKKPRPPQAKNSAPSISQSDLEAKSRFLHHTDDEHSDFISFAKRSCLSTAVQYA
ncbi:hypothetical protein PGTUg99_015293 [Puccinia graminis f. sp. tritici]|uniref:Uncharacterized protein n=1 Tax=Puccinia graminis f. sp. tritici TaxID=56615 RepID=A0A5B0Q3K9_PUCGR|nr:hypothetical protein PGTUg99_015293 [Puccinia graminis f. sp. tritici]